MGVHGKREVKENKRKMDGSKDQMTKKEVRGNISDDPKKA